MRRFLLFIVIAAVLVSLVTSFTMVEPGERAVVTRFGRVTDTVGPGLHVGLPWGIDQVHRVKVDRVRTVQIGYVADRGDAADAGTPAGQLLTADHNLVNLQAAVDFVIDEEAVGDYVFQQGRAASLVARTSEAVLAEWVAARTFAAVVERGKQTQRGDDGEPPLPQVLVEETQRRLAPYSLGVVINSARVNYLNAPDEVRDAYENVTRAETQIKTRENEAEQERADRIRAAQAERYHILRLAAAYAEEKVKLAQADAENFEKRLAQHRQLSKANPYYLNGVWWDEMSRLYRRMKDNGRIDLLDHRLGPNGLDITTMPALPKKR
jgi:membrane protease subunit HflK